MRKHGEIRERTLADKNTFIEWPSCTEVVIYGRDLKTKGRVAIDHADRKLVEEYGSWCIDPNGYVISKRMKLHQLIMGKKQGFEIDHINGIKTDNRRSNLRHVTHSQNVKNWHESKHLASGGDADSFFEALIPKQK